MKPNRWIAAAAMLAAFAAHADEPWPSKPVRLVVPSAPGGGTDVFARLLAQAMSEALKQPFVVENKPDANGYIGAETVARSKPDGYTLLVSANAALAINPAIQPPATFDVARDLAPIARGVWAVNVLVVNPSLGVKTVAEFVAAAKKKPGTLAFGSPGIGSAPYLGPRMIQEIAGIDVMHVPYKGVGPAYQDLVGGRLQFMYTDLASVLPFIQSGKVDVLAVDRPSPLLPGVPTFAESGLPFDAPTSFMVMAPAGIAPALQQRIAGQVVAALKTLAPRLEQQALVPVYDTPARFASDLREERARWAGFIQRNHIKAE
jgi:tripartite-type tricarboxylate transporter receptor subunit TctC